MELARIPTPFGEFYAGAYERDGCTHVAMICGDVRSGDQPVLVRVHSKCLTGDTLFSARCDCRAQLELAMRKISEVGRGVLLYLDQEGRGIGLANKLRAYALQDAGHDTISANLELGFEVDARDYAPAAEILRDLGVSRVALLTNNPKKIAALTSHGIEVAARVPLITKPTAHNEAYLRAKRDQLGHLLDL